MSIRRRLAPGALLGALALLGTLSACGDDGSATAEGTAPSSVSESVQSEPASSSPAAQADAPGCADTWQAEAKLPRGYRGCVDDAGAYVEADRLRCSSGQAMIRYDDRWYAVPGGTIHEAPAGLDDDREYLTDVRTCRA